MARVQFSKQTKANKTIFYPYQLKESDTRLDVVSDKYYKDSDYAWLVAMTNDVIDPYYETGLTTDSLDAFVVAKYGSINEAIESIAFWRNDWISDDSILGVDTFNNLLVGQKKYYDAVLNYEGMVIGYQRKQEDWVVNTNKIVQLGITSDTMLPVEARIKINDETLAVVVFCNSSIITIQDVQGVVPESGIITTNTSTISYNNTISTTFCIDPTEEVYWSPISNYTNEQEINTDRRNIKLLDNRLAQDTLKEMIGLLNT